MISSIINSNEIEKAEALLLLAPYDRTASFRKGAAKGPEAIKYVLEKELEFFNRTTGKETANEYKIAALDSGISNKLTPEKMVNHLEKIYTKFFNPEKRFILLVGGEHSVSIGPLRAISKIMDSKKITILQIDAHFDFRDSDEDYNEKSPSRFAHSTVMRRAKESGFSLMNVGVRTYSKEELDFAKKNSIYFEYGIGVNHNITDILAKIQTDDVYVTIDVDGIDPSQMPATGTPVQNGLSWDFTEKLLYEIFKLKNVIGADIVEVAPRSDDVLTEYGAAQLCYSMLSYKLN